MAIESFEEHVTRDFKNRFWELYKRSGCTSVAQFANLLEMNRQSVDRYYNGKRLPDLPSIYQICKKMDVSADWLLGLSDVSSISADKKIACEVTGLSENAADKISKLDGQTMSKLIENINFDGFVQCFGEYCHLLDNIKSYEQYKNAEDDIDVNLSNGRTVKMPCSLALALYEQRLTNSIIVIYQKAMAERMVELIRLEKGE